MRTPDQARPGVCAPQGLQPVLWAVHRAAETKIEALGGPVQNQISSQQATKATGSSSYTSFGNTGPPSIKKKEKRGSIVRDGGFPPSWRSVA